MSGEWSGGYGDSLSMQGNILNSVILQQQKRIAELEQKFRASQEEIKAQRRLIEGSPKRSPKRSRTSGQKFVSSSNNSKSETHVQRNMAQAASIQRPFLEEGAHNKNVPQSIEIAKPKSSGGLQTLELAPEMTFEECPQTHPHDSQYSTVGELPTDLKMDLSGLEELSYGKTDSVQFDNDWIDRDEDGVFNEVTRINS
eukprot:CAMPEP_0184744266 /NCGR_PEP_ID=MMETSP0315-20130426/7090_1 /TAXON_ID=101924 /ORGANISM="Rhodosorus marinus, Strain UTEX LB 2760" /LENGTH=197 /DNA_ID=CAMNT_0027215945 /DNA_START=592 /DNA_END=1185 /DNA_ORIENTATION=+